MSDIEDKLQSSHRKNTGTQGQGRSSGGEQQLCLPKRHNEHYELMDFGQQENYKEESK